MPHPVFAPDKTAVVTGGAAGIGLAAARRLTRDFEIAWSGGDLWCEDGPWQGRAFREELENDARLSRGFLTMILHG